MGGLGTIGTSGVMVPAWDSSKESKSRNLFSITFALGTLVASCSSLTRATTGRGLGASSSVSSVQ